ncbi:hypothetical protein [Burkholderia cenocepacia]|uniref:Uncharacterized protein n=1 Tax=Burkholderia cenocepacia TaxID=95486 RepID=A0ABD4UMY7_9BURK|nr:hypothetical protein [Burkholderia cenocepacia]MCW3699898.1 hypothetical protein [Burkholderia cenocepacia]MCW3707559.1 hypothetical protein [Burkholderia cenocepacia]MCW3715803.1 hypothetical protein [Burkholderia cenocepacia]MCW3723883.1 hypothetical protein [Burkholderia cenocepacia]MCW3733243.1 hypothetical protein [Burkholderia cenocepacia]
MTKMFSIAVSDATAASLRELAARCTRENKRSEGFTSHGDLTPETLLEMLAEDAAMVISRPGSWEGSNMAQVFSSHGYEI